MDDGFGIVMGRDECVRASNRVRRDLVSYGVLTEELMSEWGTRRNLVWTGLVWDIVGFKLWVMEEKLVRVECLLEDLWMERGKVVKVRKIAKVAGVIGSFT